MIGNLVILVIVFALTIGAGYLTYRAARSKRRWLVKIPATLLAGALTLVLAAVSFIGLKGFTATYTPAAVAAPSLTVQGTPEQIARGKYLVNIACTGCHGTDGQFPLTGGFDMATEIPIPIGAMKASNLTPAGAIAKYSDGELFRVLRQGIGKDGLWLGMMSRTCPIVNSAMRTRKPSLPSCAHKNRRPARCRAATTTTSSAFCCLALACFHCPSLSPKVRSLHPPRLPLPITASTSPRSANVVVAMALI